MAGAPTGNRNAAKGKLWEGAIRRALHEDREALRLIAKQVIEEAKQGEPWAVTEIRNTLDGKPREFKEIHKTVERRLSYAERIEKEKAARAPRSPAEPLGHSVQ